LPAPKVQTLKNIASSQKSENKPFLVSIYQNRFLLMFSNLRILWILPSKRWSSNRSLQKIHSRYLQNAWVYQTRQNIKSKSKAKTQEVDNSGTPRLLLVKVVGKCHSKYQSLSIIKSYKHPQVKHLTKPSKTYTDSHDKV